MPRLHPLGRDFLHDAGRRLRQLLLIQRSRSTTRASSRR
jgi:hypothetical protein